MRKFYFYLLLVAIAGALCIGIYHTTTFNPYEKVNEFVFINPSGCDEHVVIFIGKNADKPPDLALVYDKHKLVCYIYRVEDTYFVVKNGEVTEEPVEKVNAFLNFFLEKCQRTKS